MASLIPGFEYDVIISYRQKDNKGDRCVSEFVDVKYQTEHERVRKWLKEQEKPGLLEEFQQLIIRYESK